MDSKVHILISFIVFVFFVIGTFLFSYLDRRKIRKELEDPSGTLISPDERIIADRTKMLFIGIGLTLFGGYSVLFVRINTTYMIAVSIMLFAGIFILLLFLRYGNIQIEGANKSAPRHSTFPSVWREKFTATSVVGIPTTEFRFRNLFTFERRKAKYFSEEVYQERFYDTKYRSAYYCRGSWIYLRLYF